MAAMPVAAVAASAQQVACLRLALGRLGRPELDGSLRFDLGGVSEIAELLFSQCGRALSQKDRTIIRSRVQNASSGIFQPVGSLRNPLVDRNVWSFRV